MGNGVAKLVSIIGLLVIVFCLGMVWPRTQLWPTSWFKEASRAASAFHDRYLAPDVSLLVAPDDRSGATVHEPSRVESGYTLISQRNESAFGAQLIELDGTVVHRWQTQFDEVWPDGAPQIIYRGNPEQVRWHGVHLFPNGDLLINLEIEGFPYAGGLVKLDKDSKVLWKVERNTHHAVKVRDDGTMFVPALNYHAEPLPGLEQLGGQIYEDVVLEISPDGEIIDEISMPQALAEMKGVLRRPTDGRDPTHLNDVEVVTPEFAAAFPLLKEGDLVVSLRNPNVLVGIDRRSKRATWLMLGPWVQQHDLDLLPGGVISLYDNQGGPQACGGSRVIKVDPATQKVLWQYDGCEGNRFRSVEWGEQQSLPNGNLLIIEAFGGRAFEVTTDAQPRVVWEYVNRLPAQDGKPRRGLVGEAHRFPYDALTFVSRPIAGPDASPPTRAVAPSAG